MASVSWVSCDGGPHLLLPREVASMWSGTSAPPGRIVNARFRWSADPSSPASDYDAACDVSELVGLVPVGEGLGLVLGDEVPMSTWVEADPFTGGLLVVPMAWPDPGMPHERLLAAVRSVNPSSYVDTGLRLPAPSGNLVLCAAADAGPQWFYPTVDVHAPPGTLEVLSAEVKVHGFWLRLHALHSVNSPPFERIRQEGCARRGMPRM
jgi:hypothetical protein